MINNCKCMHKYILEYKLLLNDRIYKKVIDFKIMITRIISLSGVLQLEQCSLK